MSTYIDLDKVKSVYIYYASVKKIYIDNDLVFQKTSGCDSQFTLVYNGTSASSYTNPFSSGSITRVCWGDGSTEEYTGQVLNHNYETSDEYTVKFTGEPNGFNEVAFWGCTGLTSVTFNKNLTNIEASAFWGCTGLTSVTFNENLTSIGPHAFRECGLTSVTFNENLTSIGHHAFQGCSDLTSVNFNKNLTSIENAAFIYCSGFISVTFNENLTSIGDYAFSDCTGLTSVTFNENLTSIGDAAFRRCNLKNLTFKSTTPPTAQSTATFYGISGATITVPQGCLEAYKTAPNYPNPSTNTYVEEV